MNRFSHLTDPVDGLELGIDLPPIPDLHEPDVMPRVSQSRIARASADPLIPVAAANDFGGPWTSTGRVTDLSAYRSVDLPGALPESWARASVVRRLASAAATLPHGYGLAVFDAWRPLALQQHLFDEAYADPTLPPGFVTPPSTDPATPPPHLTGATLDVTLTYRGTALALGTDFDDFTSAAHTAALETTPSHARDHRRLLFWAMRSAGFVVLDCEWWHFEYGTRRWAALTGRDPLFAAASPLTERIAA